MLTIYGTGHLSKQSWDKHSKCFILKMSYCTFYNKKIRVATQWNVAVIHWVTHNASVAMSGASGLLPLFLLVFISYASLSLFPFICASLHLPFASFSVVPPLYPTVRWCTLVLCSDYMWHDLYIGFTVLAALWGITCIPEYFSTSTRAGVFFLYALFLVCIHLPFFGWLPPLAICSTLCNVRNTSP